MRGEGPIVVPGPSIVFKTQSVDWCGQNKGTKFKNKIILVLDYFILGDLNELVQRKQEKTGYPCIT